MRNFLDEGGKGTQGFIEVIMDEIDDIRIDLSKKVLSYQPIKYHYHNCMKSNARLK